MILRQWLQLVLFQAVNPAVADMQDVRVPPLQNQGGNGAHQTVVQVAQARLPVPGIEP
jgi:hypothetical protein